jgi:hypothetical protein
MIIASGCGMTHFKPQPAQGSETSQSLADLTDGFVNQVESISFYKGGFFAGPGEPSWSHDLVIEFGVDGLATVHAKDLDPLCGKEGVLSNPERDQLVSLIRSVSFDVSSGIKTQDQGVEVLKINGRRGEAMAIHLLDGEVPAGQFVASNGAQLAQYLKSIDENLQRVCQ